MAALANVRTHGSHRNAASAYSLDLRVASSSSNTSLFFSTFRKQVEFCQKTLLDLDKLQTVQCLSSLTISPIHIFEYQCTSSDPLTAEIQEIETKEIKQEIEPKIDADFDFDETTQVEHEVYVQENEVKVKKGKKNKIKSKKKTKVKTKVDYASDLDDVKDKFVEVEFTEEEMLKSREEKRSHPNFKKLPYHCGTCVLGFTRKENYDLHLVKKHEKKHYHCYHCKLCTYETTELWSALSHCRTKHSADSEDCIHCPQCSYVAKTREEMAEHRKTHTLAFRSRGRLEAHMAGHGAGVAARLAYCARCQVHYHCEVCNKKFASKVYYKRHYTFYHQKSSPFKCELCNRTAHKETPIKIFVKEKPESLVRHEDLEQKCQQAASQWPVEDTWLRSRQLELTEEVDLKSEPESEPEAEAEAARDSESTVTCDEDCGNEEDYRLVRLREQSASSAAIKHSSTDRREGRRGKAAGREGHDMDTLLVS
ncbi:hypothetical protein MSG28_015875 [Choristoneura fumiferana]|uniref:Uncharacterized protein n=1 Tax=Choristoneura fumiferana TaxID=7141 RepID=A0ACC0K5A3_CHOFU|nr:hypothetical protein MSG28_015875 [Choristoneura fumiferana]